MCVCVCVCVCVCYLATANMVVRMLLQGGGVGPLKISLAPNT